MHKEVRNTKFVWIYVAENVLRHIIYGHPLYFRAHKPTKYLISENENYF